MSKHETELLSALADLEGAAEKPCGCEGSEKVFESASLTVGPGDLAGELKTALSSLLSESKAGGSPDQPFQEFMDVEMGLPISLEDVIAVAERYPGLKITFSF